VKKKFALHLLLIVLFAGFSAPWSRGEAPPLEAKLNHYIEAVNRHDVEEVRAMIAEDAIWYLGPYALRGPDQMLRPLTFDEGANTVLEASHIVVSGDTVDFDVVERNDVLKAYGIPALHHFARMVFRDGLIYRITARRPPLEQKAFVASAIAFRRWLEVHRPELYDKFYPGGQLNYARSTGEEMPKVIAEWKRSGD
jgi:SnoaL-like domain